MSKWIDNRFVEEEDGVEVVTSFVCPCCGVNLEFKQMYALNGTPVKGLKVTCPLCGYEEQRSFIVIVCDLCKRNKAHEIFMIPKNNQYWAMKNGVHLMPFYKLEKTGVVICNDCQKAIARLVYAIESESDKVDTE